jgi:hypothetical protein
MSAVTQLPCQRSATRVSPVEASEVSVVALGIRPPGMLGPLTISSRYERIANPGRHVQPVDRSFRLLTMNGNSPRENTA